MADPNPSAAAVETLRQFNAKYPAVGADLIQLLKDLAAPLKDTIDADIQANAPNVPLVRGWIVSTGDSVVNATVDNFVASLAAAIETNGA